MTKIVLPLGNIPQISLPQLQYSLSFVSEHLLSYSIDFERKRINLTVSSENYIDEISRKIQELIERYSKQEFGFPEMVFFKQERELPVINAWDELISRRLITQVGHGHVIIRGLAAQLLNLIDSKVDQLFASRFSAEEEFYPSTILSRTLDRCNHFTSFPEHVDFVAHLRQDLDILRDFSEGCRAHGWSPALHEGRMAENDFAICPSCCYHCYEGMEGWQLEPPGRCITACLVCHRFEGANHRTLSRLRSFTMREIIWIGRPQYVLDSRAEAERLIISWAKDWELAGTFETANDMFFTQDYSIKASFQRQQQAKKELRLYIPYEQQAISVLSSNFHALTFGKAFNITIGGRPCASACIGWGYERWIYAILSQFGFNVKDWPENLRTDFIALGERK